MQFHARADKQQPPPLPAHTPTHTLSLSLHPADSFLQPDEVTFAVLLRGYGGSDPPAWVKIDATLTRMRQQYDIVPTASESGLCVLGQRGGRCW